MSENVRKQKRRIDDYEDDLRLVQAVAEGSLDAWHAFVDQYAGLIYGVVRRHLLAEDEDDVRSVYVDVLSRLYEGEIQTFRAESSLATWLIAFTRNRAFDHARKRHGRRRDPAGIDRLSEFDREVLRLFYMERLPLDIVVHVLSWRGGKVTADEVVESMQRIEEIVDRRYLSRLDREYMAKRYGIDSRCILAYVADLRQEYDEKTHGNRPDVHLMKEEARGIVERVHEMVSELTTVEQEVASLWFDKRLAAPEIARKLGLKNQRRVYTIKNKLMQKIRKSLEAERIE